MLQSQLHPCSRRRRGWQIHVLFLICLVSVCALTYSAWAQSPSDLAVQVSATIQGNPAQIQLTWPVDGYVSSYSIYQKGLSDTSWGTAIATGLTASGSAINYTVNSGVTVGKPYEFKVVGTGYVSAYGYVATGIDLPLVDNRGKVILMIEATTGGQLTTEIAQLINDFVGDGWTVIPHYVYSTDTVKSVQALVDADYQADPTNVKALFLLGNVPIALSGWLNPDGHYSRPFPTDLYYGIVGGTWTDDELYGTGTESESNVPGDGKFDQNTITDPFTNPYVPAGTVVPAQPVTLEVGRVDLSNMPAFDVYSSEVTRLSNYLNKDHNYRMASFPYLSQGLICDNFGYFSGEAFAQNGWRNFAPFFGAGNLTAGAWLGNTANNWFITENGYYPEPYLWGYGCGGGSPTSASGVGQSTDLLTHDPAIFTMLFGSYFGEWNDANDFMRAELCTPNYGLTCSWSGRPNWFYHRMGIGMEIGDSARLSQNNYANPLYQNTGICNGELHVCLMGDPTLRVSMVPPIAQVNAQQTGYHTVKLTWSPPLDLSGNTLPNLAGYAVYRVTLPYGPITRMNPGGLDVNTSYTDTNPANGDNTYMVRAVTEDTSTSSSYLNGSEGTMVTINAIVPLTAVTLTTSPTTPQYINTPITLTAAGNGGSNLQYQFLVYNQNVSPAWSLLQAYSTTNTCSWTPTAPGTYLLYAYAQDPVAGTQFDTTLSYTITTPPLTAVSLAASLPSPQPVNTPITFTAAATGGVNVQYQYWSYNPSVTPAWSPLQAFSTSATYHWLPETPGNYLLEVTAQDGTTGTEKSTGIWFAVTTLTGVTVTPSLASPQAANTAITLTAAATGGSNVQYQFWSYDPNASPTWNQVQAFSSSATCTWKPTTSDSYLLSVTAQDGLTGAQVNSSFWYIITNGPPLTAVALTTSVASPQAMGTSITLTAKPTGGQNDVLDYVFWLYNPTASPAWSKLQAYNGNTYTWTPTLPGNFLLTVTAMDEENGLAATASCRYTVSSGAPLVAVIATPSPASPQPAKTPITITATAVGGANVSYQFWVYNATAANPAWSQLQNTPSPTCAWTPAKSGTYLLSITAQDGIIGTTANTMFWYTVQ